MDVLYISNHVHIFGVHEWVGGWVRACVPAWVSEWASERASKTVSPSVNQLASQSESEGRVEGGGKQYSSHQLLYSTADYSSHTVWAGKSFSVNRNNAAKHATVLWLLYNHYGKIVLYNVYLFIRLCYTCNISITPFLFIATLNHRILLQEVQKR